MGPHHAITSHCTPYWRFFTRLTADVRIISDMPSESIPAVKQGVLSLCSYGGGGEGGGGGGGYKKMRDVVKDGSIDPLRGRAQ